MEKFVESESFAPFVQVVVSDKVKTPAQQSNQLSAESESRGSSGHVLDIDDTVTNEIIEANGKDVKIAKLDIGRRNSRRSSARGKENRGKISERSSPHQGVSPSTSARLKEEPKETASDHRPRSSSPLFYDANDTKLARSPFADSDDDDSENNDKFEKFCSEVSKCKPVPCTSVSTVHDVSFNKQNESGEQSVPFQACEKSTDVQPVPDQCQENLSPSSPSTVAREGAITATIEDNKHAFDDVPNDGGCNLADIPSSFIVESDIDNDPVKKDEENNKSCSDGGGGSNNNESGGDSDGESSDEENSQNEGGDNGRKNDKKPSPEKESGSGRRGREADDDDSRGDGGDDGGGDNYDPNEVG